MANGTYGTPMVSSVMPNPMGVTSAGMNKPASMSQPMTTTGLQAGTVRNMNLPLSRATPIQVNETTPNLEEIQNFPVAGRGLDGTHFHQDPVSGQMYVMTEEFHQRIPEILRTRTITNRSISNNNGDTLNYSKVPLLNYDTNSIYGRKLKKGYTLDVPITQKGLNNVENNIGYNALLNSSISNLFDSSLLISDEKSARASVGFKYKQQEKPVSFSSDSSLANVSTINLNSLDLNRPIPEMVNGSLSTIKTPENNPLLSDEMIQITTNSRLNRVSDRKLESRLTTNIFPKSNLISSPQLNNQFQFIPVNSFVNLTMSSQFNSNLNSISFIPINRFYNYN